MSKPRVVTFKSMAKRHKAQVKKAALAKPLTVVEQKQLDFDERFEAMKYGHGYTYDF